ncbi:MAG: YlbF family regulator [Bacillota bacterium]|nr:YlbF family regulator [Bacillota bacterium]
MSVYNTAHQLAAQLAKSDEYSAYRTARKAIESDQQMVWLLKDFRRRQMELQFKIASGAKPSDDEMATYSSLAEAIGMHKPLSEFLTAEASLMRVVADLQKILLQGIDLLDYMEEPPGKKPEKAGSEPPRDEPGDPSGLGKESSRTG